MANSLFNFRRVDTFEDDINREDCFDTLDMDGVSKNYRFILASACAVDINKCLDMDGTLITPYDSENLTGVNIINTEGVDDGFVSMLWSKGVNGERTMSIADSVVMYDLGESAVPVQACFLANVGDGSGYVLAYAINTKPVELSGEVIMPVDGVVWRSRYGY